MCYSDCSQADCRHFLTLARRCFSLSYPSLFLLLGVGIFGLTGLDRLVCFMIVRTLTDFVRLFRKLSSKNVTAFLQQVEADLHPTAQFPPNTSKLYSVATTRMSKLVPLFLELVCRLGQLQLIRRQVANELNFSAKLESKILCSALETMNLALTNDVKAHYTNPEEKPYPGNPCLPDIAEYLETAGE